MSRLTYAVFALLVGLGLSAGIIASGLNGTGVQFAILAVCVIVGAIIGAIVQMNFKRKYRSSSTKDWILSGAGAALAILAIKAGADLRVAIGALGTGFFAVTALRAFRGRRAVYRSL